MSDNFWTKRDYEFLDERGADYFVHDEGVFAFQAFRISESNPYFVSFDRIDAGKSAKVGDFDSLEQAQAFIEYARLKGNFYTSPAGFVSKKKENN